MAIYKVTANVVKVSLGASTGNRVAHFARQGEVLPDGVVPEQLKSLLERKLIEEIKEEAAPTGRQGNRGSNAAAAKAAAKEAAATAAKESTDANAALAEAVKTHDALKADAKAMPEDVTAAEQRVTELTKVATEAKQKADAAAAAAK